MRRRKFKRLEADGVPRFLTFTCYRRYQLLNSAALGDHFVRSFAAAISRHPAIHPLAWVVMPEHVHLVLLPEEEGAMTSFLMGFKRPFAQSVLGRWRELHAPVLNRLLLPDGKHRYWQTGGGFDRLLHGNELFEKIAYCHKNPITRGLAKTSIEWAWSSARQYEKLDDPIGPRVVFDVLPPTDRPLT
jgi:REP element-mobilizing transposase RayT